MVMQSVKKVALSGRSVICTMHQPSYNVMQLFDQLLLLKHGGRLVSITTPLIHIHPPCFTAIISSSASVHLGKTGILRPLR